MQYKEMLGEKGQTHCQEVLKSTAERRKYWAQNSSSIIEERVKWEADLVAEQAGISNKEPEYDKLHSAAANSFRSQKQISLVGSVYVAEDSIKMFRKIIRPLIVRRTRSAAHESAMIKWDNFLQSQKDAAFHLQIYYWKQEEVAQKAEVGSLVKQIPADWNRSNINEKASTRMLTADTIIEHFWTGNPLPIVFAEDGTRDLEATVRPLIPCNEPRKILVYVAYHAHRDLMAMMFLLKDRKYVCYDGSMSVKARQGTMNKFNSNPTCRIMVMSNVGSTGLNVTAASVVIIVSRVWTGLERNQIFGRVNRPGQCRDVVLYTIIAPGSIDLDLMVYSESKTCMSNKCLSSKVQLQQMYLQITAQSPDHGHELDLGSDGKITTTKVVS
ncbi:helicase carboxy-terminal domain protein [Rhizoctonia solani AG-3 Rhs1AP]|uniref:Helicase carboxy-terminal domain protein n=1 Tax=Rhizoctonia solani AG-3 Rhs1AP TaxID=1086054 RepID=X8IX57_9AGAM|nr:helicase carboxy-terminal domain protein [Rhizoctonia solani AG-3 Rhs1AP]